MRTNVVTITHPLAFPGLTCSASTSSKGMLNTNTNKPGLMLAHPGCR